MKIFAKTISLILTVLAVCFAATSCDVDGMLDTLKGEVDGIVDAFTGIASGVLPCQHSWVEATCAEAKHCELCGETDGKPLAHTETTVPGYAPTCSTSGLTDGIKCSECDAVIKAQAAIPTVAHTEMTVTGYAPSCTETGLTDGVKCRVCDTPIVEQEVISATGHTEGAEATCTTDQKCTVCDEVLVERHHTPETVEGYDSTCTATGLTDGVRCSECLRTLTAQQTIQKKPHAEEIIPAVAPGCYDEGFTEGVKCSVCETVLTAPTSVEALGHVFVDGSCTACEQGYYNEGMTFTLFDYNGEKYYIAESIGSSADKDIVIPATYKGIPVGKIGPDFTRYSSHKYVFETITIPSSVKYIDCGFGSYSLPGPFKDCVNLKKVYIESLEDWFGVEIGTVGVTNPLHYGAELYAGGELVTEVTVPSSVTELYNDLFDGCSSITKVNLHDSLYVLGGFWNLPGVTEITIPSSVKIILSKAFYNCTALETVNITDTTNHIFGGAFEGTAFYNNPDNWDEGNVFYIGNHLIEAKESIEGAYTVRAGTKSISASAFEYCRKLSSLTLCDGIITIGYRAFAYTESLQSITIPYSVRYIGFDAFDNMYNGRYGIELIFQYQGAWYQHVDLYQNLSSPNYIYGIHYGYGVVYYVDGQKVTGGSSGWQDHTYSEAICR